MYIVTFGNPILDSKSGIDIKDPVLLQGTPYIRIGTVTRGLDIHINQVLVNSNFNYIQFAQSICHFLICANSIVYVTSKNHHLN